MDSYSKTVQVIFHLAITELKLRYRGTSLGFLWSVLEPIIQLGVLYVIFSAIHPTDQSFIVYLFIGLITIHFFSRSTSQGMNSIVNKKSIIISLRVPRIIFPFSIVLSNLYMFMIEIGFFIAISIMLKISITNTIIIFPIIVGLIIILTAGMTLILSSIRLYFKDVQSIWSIVTMSLIFVCPVFWHVSEMSKEIKQILFLNPLALLIEMSHQVILYGIVPTNEGIIYVVVVTIAIFIIGLTVFNKIERKMAEII